jgi:CBS domain containing-hemolysin-like protein
LLELLHTTDFSFAIVQQDKKFAGIITHQDIFDALAGKIKSKKKIKKKN